MDLGHIFIAGTDYLILETPSTTEDSRLLAWPRRTVIRVHT